MKKLFLVLSVMILALSSAYAQDEAAVDTAAEQTSTANQGESIDTPKELAPYSPSFIDLRNTDDIALDKEYYLLQTNLVKVKEDYLFRILYKANKIIERYTNVNFTDTNGMFYNMVTYYGLVSKPIAGDNNVDLALVELNKSFALYESIKPTYVILGKTNELMQSDYQLNLYAGIFNLFKGTQSHYVKGRDHLMKALENETSNGNDPSNLIMINTYLAGVNYNLATINQHSDVNKVFYLNEMFNNLWDLTTLKTEDENIKAAKYRLLISKYHKILYTTSVRFKTIYVKYFDELGFTYGNTEDEVLSRDLRPIYRDAQDGSEPGASGSSSSSASEESAS